MRVIISKKLFEAFETSHFKERYEERIPETIRNNRQLLFQIEQILTRIKKFRFPRIPVIIRMITVDNKSLFAIVRDSIIKTIIYDYQYYLFGTLNVFDLDTFFNTVNFIRSNDFPIGTWLYIYTDHPYNDQYLMIKSKTITEVLPPKEFKRLKQTYKVFNEK